MNQHTAQTTLAQDFVEFAVAVGALRFGEFKTKAGRVSPYFFNAGLFDDGCKLARLAKFYALRLMQARAEEGLEFDMLFGPAYKGITLAAGVAMELAQLGHNVPYAYNRKEAKDHGEGGLLVGAPLRGRVLIIDDVVSAGTSVRESVTLIQVAGGTACAVGVAIDRQEKANDQFEGSALQFVEQQLGLKAVSIATLDDLLQYLRAHADPALQLHFSRVAAYRERYGA